MNRFTDLPQNFFENSTLIIDVDGTLVADKNTNIEDPVLQKIREFAENNEVFICSNGSPKNAEKFAQLSGTKFFKCLKPFRGNVLTILPKRPTVVIGDKYLTDGLFALNIGASFVKIGHLKSANDKLFTKATYLLDDTVWKLRNYLMLMRPWQWIKNLLVFAPVFFAGGLQNSNSLVNVFIATIIFSIFSSATYVFNDIFDFENDKKHINKKNRPLASGLISTKEAVILCLVLLCLGAFGLYYLPSIALIMLAYVALNIIYTLLFKNIAVLDAISVASCYVLRILAGGFAASVYISPWIILCVFFGALFVVLGKRKGEFNKEKRRKVLEEYSEKGLDMLFTASGVATLVVYSIWSVLGHSSNYLIFSTVFVAVAIFRLMDVIYKGSELSESPELLVFKDRVVFVSFSVWIVYVSLTFYLSIL